MPTDKIVEALEAERNRLDQAIAALRGTSTGKRGKRRGRKPGSRLSAAARRKISLAAKRRWAAWRKNQGGA